MINNEMKSAFDTNSAEFKAMMDIIKSRFFEEKRTGDELHHIVPVTWYAQNDAVRPDWADVTDWADLIRNSDKHPANLPANLVYLSKKEHEEVHRLMGLCSWDNWTAPSKGRYEPINKVAMLDNDKNVVEVFDSLEAAGNYAVDVLKSASKSASEDLRWHINHHAKHWGYYWERVKE